MFHIWDKIIEQYEIYRYTDSLCCPFKAMEDKTRFQSQLMHLVCCKSDAHIYQIPFEGSERRSSNAISLYPLENVYNNIENICSCQCIECQHS